MPTLANECKTGCLDAVVDRIDLGSGDSSGDFVLKNAGGTILANMTFGTTAFGSATISGSNATVDSNSITDSGTPIPGTIASGAFRNKSNTEMISFTMGVGGSFEMQIADSTITSAYTAVGCSKVTVTMTFA